MRICWWSDFFAFGFYCIVMQVMQQGDVHDAIFFSSPSSLTTSSSTWPWTTRWSWRCWGLRSPTWRPDGGWLDVPLLLFPFHSLCWVSPLTCMVIQDNLLEWFTKQMGGKKRNKKSLCNSAEDHTDLDPAVLATLKKLQDGYYGGSRWGLSIW